MVKRGKKLTLLCVQLLENYQTEKRRARSPGFHQKCILWCSYAQLGQTLLCPYVYTIKTSSDAAYDSSHHSIEVSVKALQQKYEPSCTENLYPFILESVECIRGTHLGTC